MITVTLEPLTLMIQLSGPTLQNHTLIQFGRDVWRSSSPTSLREQPQLDQAEQRQKYHNLSQHLFSCFDTLMVK